MNISILGTESNNKDSEDKKCVEYDMTEKFSDYIKRNFTKRLKYLKTIKTLDNHEYVVEEEEDLNEMRKGIRYINKIYKGGEILRELAEMEENMLLQNKNEAMIIKKTTRKI